MAIPFVPDAKIWDAVSAILHKNNQDPLSSEYAEIVSEANRLAVADLYRILTVRGYAPAQIAGWDDGARYNLDQAIFWSLMRAPAFGSYPDTFVKTFDRRKELQDAPAILINGASVSPAGNPGAGGVTAGRLSAYDRILRETKRW